MKRNLKKIQVSALCAAMLISGILEQPAEAAESWSSAFYKRSKVYRAPSSVPAPAPNKPSEPNAPAQPNTPTVPEQEPVDDTRDITDGEPPQIGRCATVWTPPIETFCERAVSISEGHKDQWYANRVICADAPDGSPAMAIREYKGEYITTVSVARTDAIPKAMKDGSVVQISAEFFVPNSYKWTSAGRLPIGINVGDWTSGGVAIDKQRGSSVRLHVSNDGSLGLYSYNFDRTTKPVTGAGQSDSTVKTRVYGQGSGAISKPLPRGAWITVVVELILGAPGADKDSTFVYMYDEMGNLLGRSGKSNMTFRRSADKFGVKGMLADAKPNSTKVTPSKNQEIFVRNYKGIVCDP